MLVEADCRVVNLQRTLVKDGTSLIELGLTLVFPWIGSIATASTIDEAAWSAMVWCVAVVFQISDSIGCQAIEVVVAKDILRINTMCSIVVVVTKLIVRILTIFNNGGVSHRHTIDIHVQSARRTWGDGEALRAVIGIGDTVGTNNL